MSVRLPSRRAAAGAIFGSSALEASGSELPFFLAIDFVRDHVLAHTGKVPHRDLSSAARVVSKAIGAADEPTRMISNRGTCALRLPASGQILTLPLLASWKHRLPRSFDLRAGLVLGGWGRRSSARWQRLHVMSWRTWWWGPCS